MMVDIIILISAYIIALAQALVPIPLEPQQPCFTHFGECLRYCPGERIPDLEGIESSCITNTAGYQFCKFYHCPPSKCRGRKKDLYGKCYYCPGTCVDGGRIHTNGQAFLSFDMVNSCFCGENNSKHCTKHPVDQYAYCNHARPGSDGDTGAVVMVEQPKVEQKTEIVAVVQAPPPPPKAAEVIAVVQQPPPPPKPKAPEVIAVVQPPPRTPVKSVAYFPPPTPPKPAPKIAYVPPPPTQPPTPPHVAYVPAPTAPQTPPQYAYVPAPTKPATPPNIAYVPPPTQPPPPPPGHGSVVAAYVPGPTAPPYYQPRMVAHPNFSARNPKSNLQQRSNRNPNVYRNTHQSPQVHYLEQSETHQYQRPPPKHRQHRRPPPSNPYQPPPFIRHMMWMKKHQLIDA